VHPEEVNNGEHEARPLEEVYRPTYGDVLTRKRTPLDFCLIIYVNKNKQSELNMDKWLTLAQVTEYL